jgi:hypothetical protein
MVLIPSFFFLSFFFFFFPPVFLRWSLALQLRLAWNLRSYCFSLLSAGLQACTTTWLLPPSPWLPAPGTWFIECHFSDCHLIWRRNCLAPWQVSGTCGQDRHVLSTLFCPLLSLDKLSILSL